MCIIKTLCTEKNEIPKLSKGCLKVFTIITIHASLYCNIQVFLFSLG